MEVGEIAKNKRVANHIEIDLMTAKPKGPNGEGFVFTAVDLATRYPYVRAIMDKSAKSVAFVLFTVILDIAK